MFADSRPYPAMVIAGMYKREQELAKADEDGLIVTSKDLEDEPTDKACVICGEQAASFGGVCADCFINE